MRIIKASQYNIYFKAPDGVELVFNSLSCGLAIVDNEYRELMASLTDLKKELLDEGMLTVYNDAVAGHFIVPDDFDEQLDFQTKRNIQKYSTDSLGLTIAPTLACNFKCVYCYETSKPGIISKETEEKLIQYVDSQADRLKNLDVTWYGGEPLLAFDEIIYMSKAFLAICEKHKINYHAFMISNGSLITDAIIDQMKSFKIQGVQITIDGPKNVHDQRRVSKNHTSSFDIIISNVNKLLSNDIEVVLRINVDKTNESTLEELIGYLHEKLITEDIKITFGQVTAYTEACRSVESSCYNNAEFAKKMAVYYGILRRHGFQKANPFPYPSAKLNYCCAELLNSYVVDHEGYMYKCWNDVGNTSHSIGNINDEHFDPYGYRNGDWLITDTIQSEPCKTCNILPLCVGGCPFNRREGNYDSNCDLIKYNIEDVMLTYYNYAKEGLL